MKWIAIAAGCWMLSGCWSICWFEWRDEPYIRPLVAEGAKAAEGDLDSFFEDHRAIACRALGELACDARRRGNDEEAERLLALLMKHFDVEPSHDVRSLIVALALRDAGGGEESVSAFLFHALAGEDVPVAAAYTLAVLQPAGTFEAVLAAAERNAHGTRYELLQALWLLGDPRGVEPLRRALREIDEDRGDWPACIHHMQKPQYRHNLSERLKSLESERSR